MYIHGGSVTHILPILAEQEGGGYGHPPLRRVVHHGYEQLVILLVLPIQTPIIEQGSGSDNKHVPVPVPYLPTKLQDSNRDLKF